jgi:hypothetical protein
VVAAAWVVLVKKIILLTNTTPRSCLEAPNLAARQLGSGMHVRNDGHQHAGQSGRQCCRHVGDKSRCATWSAQDLNRHPVQDRNRLERRCGKPTCPAATTRSTCSHCRSSLLALDSAGLTFSVVRPRPRELEIMLEDSASLSVACPRKLFRDYPQEFTGPLGLERSRMLVCQVIPESNSGTLQPAGHK